MKQKPKGNSYYKRVVEVNEIYDKYARSGLSNRTIWKKFIYPIYAISEKTFYNYLNKGEEAKRFMSDNFPILKND